jgi:hypothetical protein
MRIVAKLSGVDRYFRAVWLTLPFDLAFSTVGGPALLGRIIVQAAMHGDIEVVPMLVGKANTTVRLSGRVRIQPR